MLTKELVAVSSSTRGTEYTWGPDSMLSKMDIVLLGTNGTTGFGKIVAGTSLGKITASGKYRPCVNTTTNGTGSSATSLVVDEAENIYAGDTIYVAASTPFSVVVSAVNKTTKTLTLASAQTWQDAVAVTIADGSSTAVGFLDRDTDTFSYYDSDSAAAVFADKEAVLMFRGVVVEANLNDMSAAIKTALNGHITFV